MEEITQPYILFVEGKDEGYFFKYLHMHLDLPGVQIINCEGTGNFQTKIQLYVQSDGFQIVKALGFIRDADLNPDAAFNNLKSIIEETSKIRSLPIPIKPTEIVSDNNRKLGIFIMPDNSGTGMLENLCLETINKEPVYKCIDDYIDCFSKEFSAEEKKKFNEPKARVQSYLATRIPVVKSLGDGAQKGYWDFNHDCFKQINQFVLNLFS